jgi:hypothetical protein
MENKYNIIELYRTAVNLGLTIVENPTYVERIPEGGIQALIRRISHIESVLALKVVDIVYPIGTRTDEQVAFIVSIWKEHSEEICMN